MKHFKVPFTFFASQHHQFLLFCIRILSYVKYRPIHRRVERAMRISGALVGVRLEETRHRDLS